MTLICELSVIGIFLWIYIEEEARKHFKDFEKIERKCVSNECSQIFNQLCPEYNRKSKTKYRAYDYVQVSQQSNQKPKLSLTWIKKPQFVLGQIQITDRLQFPFWPAFLFPRSFSLTSCTLKVKHLSFIQRTSNNAFNIENAIFSQIVRL